MRDLLGPATRGNPPTRITLHVPIITDHSIFSKFLRETDIPGPCIPVLFAAPLMPVIYKERRHLTGVKEECVLRVLFGLFMPRRNKGVHHANVYCGCRKVP